MKKAVRRRVLKKAIVKKAIVKKAIARRIKAAPKPVSKPVMPERPVPPPPIEEHVPMNEVVETPPEGNAVNGKEGEES